MNEEQAKHWLIDKGFYLEFDRPSSETHLAEATIEVDHVHIDIVMALSKEMKKWPKTPMEFNKWWISFVEADLGESMAKEVVPDPKITAAWTAARADRQELVACVLEMAAWFEGITATDISNLSALKHRADLINKLKAEGDAG